MSQFGAPRTLFSLNTNENSETHRSFPCTHVHTQFGGFHNCTPAARHIFTCTVTPPHSTDELCAENIPSSTRHVSPFAAHFLTVSLFHLSCCCRLLLRTQTCCPRVQLSTAKIHGRMALLRNIPPAQVMSAKESSSTGFWSNHKIKQLTTKMISKKLV